MQKLTVEEMGRISLSEFQKAEKLPIVVVLDNVRSLHNIGSVFRTSDAFLLEAIYLCGISGTPPHREIHKTALGAEESVKWQYFERTETALQSLKNASFKICAIEQVKNSLSLTDFKAEKNSKYAFVFGNEVQGVCDEALALCDQAIEIPQFGTKHSFNVSVTAGIVLWEVYKQLTN